MKTILITTANGMFGKAIANELLKKDVNLRLFVRDRSKCTINDPKAEIFTVDLDKPDSYTYALQGVDSVFLASPMDPRLADREVAVVNAAMEAGVKQIVRIYGTVNHEGDSLSALHNRVMEEIERSGIPQIKVSPGSVIETAMTGFLPSIKYMNAIYGISGHGKVSLVALKDIAEAAAHLMTTDGNDGKEFRLTGPEALDLYEIAGRFSKVLGRNIHYVDMTEEKFTKMITKYDKSLTPEMVELEMLCHLRAWKKGNAALVTDTVKLVLGRNATTIDEYILENKALLLNGMVPGFMASLMRWMS